MTKVTDNSSTLETRGWKLPLRALFFWTFVGACLARWMAQYGIGIGVLIFWCVLVGALLGALVTLAWWAGAVLYYRVRRLHVPPDAMAFADLPTCASAGAIAALIAGTLVFALHAGRVAKVDAIEMVAQAVSHNSGQPQPIRGFQTLLLLPAILCGLANSVAAAARRLRPRWPHYVARVSTVTAAASGLSLAVALVIAMYYAARDPSYKNSAGPLELAALLYGVIGALIGAVSGGVAAGAWLCVYDLRNSRSDRIFMWCVVIGLILLITELGLHDWIPNFG